MLFFFGLMEEQAIVARLEGKGLIVLTGCGHPTIGMILRMVRRLSDEPLYAIGGGLHLPITRSRGRRMGLETQQVFGTGKPIWSRIDEGDLSRTILELNRAAPRRLLLSAHDSCDHALERLEREVDAEVEVLRAGATYEI
jgi:7,8-dihydropterin-6-yl-methyl-4-(beta-D-ribofuranosyl)aminobenzene 5'-phosphate synthase